MLVALDDLFERTRSGLMEVVVKFSMEGGEEAVQSENG